MTEVNINICRIQIKMSSSSLPNFEDLRKAKIVTVLSKLLRVNWTWQFFSYMFYLQFEQFVF